MSTPQARFKGNVVVATRAALRAQRLVMLIEEKGVSLRAAERRLGISRRTSKRYRAAWGTYSADMRGRS